MSVLILDPQSAADFRSKREAVADCRDEVWEGVYVVPPMPNDEHQELQLALCIPFYDLVQVPGLGKVRPGVNVSDRHPDWKDNYRCPDVVVFLATSPAVNHGTHWVGGPDLAVEIISPGEQPDAKFDFYAKVKTREVLVVTRDPWAVELHRLKGRKLVLAGRSDGTNPAAVASAVLPVTVRLVPGQPRPRVEVAHPATGRTWLA